MHLLDRSIQIGVHMCSVCSGFTSLSTSEVISQCACLLAVVLWWKCYLTGMPRRRHSTWHPTWSQYSMQTQVQPVVVPSIDVEHHTKIHWEILPDLRHTPANPQVYTAVMVVVSQKFSKSLPYLPGLEPGTCNVWIHYAIPLTHSYFYRCVQTGSDRFCYFEIFLLCCLISSWHKIVNGLYSVPFSQIGIL